MGTYHVLNPKTQKVILTCNILFTKKQYFIDERIKLNKSEALNFEGEDEVEIEPIKNVITTPTSNHGTKHFPVGSSNEDASLNKVNDNFKDANNNEKDDESIIEGGDFDKSVIEPTRELTTKKTIMNSMKKLETSFNP